MQPDDEPMSRLDGVGDSRLRETLLHVRGRAAAPTAAEVASAMDVAPTVARSRLERLVTSGLLVPVVRRPRRGGPGSGRPAKAYAVAPEHEHIEFPRRRFERLVRLLVGALPARGRGRRLDEIGGQFGRDLADELMLHRHRAPAAFEHLAKALRRDGFQVAVEEASADGAVLVTPTCPFRPLIAHDPSLRDLDEGMWRGLVERALPAGQLAAVTCETHDCIENGACRIAVSLT